jgi:hypothetical protein
MPDYLIFICVGTLFAILSAQIGYSVKGSRVAPIVLVVGAGLIINGIYLFTKREMPCDGMIEITQENRECVEFYAREPVIDK